MPLVKLTDYHRLKPEYDYAELADDYRGCLGIMAAEAAAEVLRRGMSEAIRNTAAKLDDSQRQDPYYVAYAALEPILIRQVRDAISSRLGQFVHQQQILIDRFSGGGLVSPPDFSWCDEEERGLVYRLRDSDGESEAILVMDGSEEPYSWAAVIFCPVTGRSLFEASFDDPVTASKAVTEKINGGIWNGA